MRPRPVAALVLAAALAFVAPCSAQSGGLSKDIVETRVALTSAQQSALGEYADRIGKVFTEGDPAEVVGARNEVIDLCRNVNASEIFRRDLGVALVKRFATLAKSTETFRPTNAFIVAQFLRTPDALDFLLDNVDPATQPDASLRASAASHLAKVAPHCGLVPAQTDAVAKRLANIASQETNWMAVTGEIEAVGEMLASKLPPAQAESVAASMANILNNVTQRVQSGEHPDLVRALQRGLLVVRNQLTTPQSPGKKLLQGIGPSLTAIDGMERKPPEQIAQNAQLDAAFKNVVITADLLQRLSSEK